MKQIFDSLIEKLVALYIFVFASKIDSLTSGFMFVFSIFMWVLGAVLGVVALAIPILLVFAMIIGIRDGIRALKREAEKLLLLVTLKNGDVSVRFVFFAIVVVTILVAFVINALKL